MKFLLLILFYLFAPAFLNPIANLNQNQTNLNQTNLNQTSLSQTNLNQTSLSQTNLNQTSLSQTNLNQTSLNLNQTNVDRASRQLTSKVTIGGVTYSITTGIGEGFYKMKDQQIIQIQSSNYGKDTYRSGDATVWRFFGTDCSVSATCPCFDVPSSLKCFGDYLKISDVPFYDQKFCGDTKPGTDEKFRSGSGNLRIRFRSDFAGEGQGFLCYVFCTKFGNADPATPKPACFTAPPTAQLGAAPGCPEPGQPSGNNDLTGPVNVNPPLINVVPNCTKIVKTSPSGGSSQQREKVNWIPIAGRRLQEEKFGS